LHEIGFSVVGIDLSEVLINAAKRRLPYLDLRVGSFICIAEPNAAFSHVLISSNAIDLALPESNRTVALRECARVLQHGGTLIYSCHNLKCLHLLSPRYWRRPFWKLRHTLKAFKSIAQVSEDGLHGLFVAPETAIRQTEGAGLRFLEMVGPTMSANPWFNRYFSFSIHYAFRKS
jgi:ubiquinone/menaquinone biosynthesis C-methylase UbiE